MPRSIFITVLSLCAGISSLHGELPGLSEPLVILQQPTNRTVTAGSLHPTFESVFYVWARGAQPLDYQWYKDGAPLDEKTDSSLNIGSVSTNDAGIYTVIISNRDGSITSDAARLTVIGPEPASLLGNPFREIPLPKERPMSSSAIYLTGEFAARDGVITFPYNGTIFRHENGEWRASLDKAAPGASSVVRELNGMSVGDNGEVLFVAPTSTSSTGLYHVNAAGGLSLILEGTNPMPRSLGSMNRPLRRNGVTAFLGREAQSVGGNEIGVHSDGIYGWDGTNIFELVTRGMVPPGNAKGLAIYSFDFDGENIIISGGTASAPGVHALFGGTQWLRLAALRDFVPGTSMIIETVGRVSIHGRHSAFELYARETSSSLVLMESTDADLRLIVRHGQELPGIGPIRLGPSYPAANNIKVLDRKHVLLALALAWPCGMEAKSFPSRPPRIPSTERPSSTPI